MSRHCDSVVAAILIDGEPAEAAGTGRHAELFAFDTPFYAEGGGQVADRGEIRAAGGRFVVEDVQRVGSNLIAHRGVIVDGSMCIRAPIELIVDAHRRHARACHHTATHLLHAALREVLGPQVQQAGSLVAPERLRFDFTHSSPLSNHELWRVEQLVNERIRMNLLVDARVMGYQQALQEGALAFFEDQYAERVRVLSVGPRSTSSGTGDTASPVSVELCGGTHLRATGEAGLFFIVAQSSIGTGLRRIDGVVAGAAEMAAREGLNLVGRVTHRLGISQRELDGRVAVLLDEVQLQRRQLSELQERVLSHEVDQILDQGSDCGEIRVVSARVTAMDLASLQKTGDLVRQGLNTAFVVVLGAVVERKPAFIVLVSPDLTSRGVHAGKIAREVGNASGGSGGGHPGRATAGGRNVSMLDQALSLVRTLVTSSDLSSESIA